MHITVSYVKSNRSLELPHALDTSCYWFQWTIFLQPIKMDEEEAESEPEAEEETPVLKYDDLISIRAIKMQKGGLKSVLKDDSRKVARLSISEHGLKDAVKTLGTDIVRSVKAV